MCAVSVCVCVCVWVCPPRAHCDDFIIAGHIWEILGSISSAGRRAASPAWLDVPVVAYSQIDANVGPLDACDIDRCRLPDIRFQFRSPSSAQQT